MLKKIFSFLGQKYHLYAPDGSVAAFVKKALGDDALIVANRSCPGGIEITALAASAFPGEPAMRAAPAAGLRWRAAARRAAGRCRRWRREDHQLDRHEVLDARRHGGPDL